MEQLVCYAAQAEMWESDILPGRLKPYDPAWLDTLFQSGELSWRGSEKQQVTLLQADSVWLKKTALSRFAKWRIRA
jgi:ATP-dependent Lhr-like helicase